MCQTSRTGICVKLLVQVFVVLNILKKNLKDWKLF